MFFSILSLIVLFLFMIWRFHLRQKEEGDVPIMLIFFTLFIIVLYSSLVELYEGYPTNVRIRGGIYQKVEMVNSPSGEQYLLAYEPTGRIRLFSLEKEDDTSSLWLKICPSKRPGRVTEDLFFRPLEVDESTTGTLCATKN